MNYFLKRGSGPLVSVLIPSRGRPAGLLAAIDSLWSLAENKSLVEFIVKVDDDDAETIAVLADLKQKMPHLALSVHVSPRGRGYEDLHLFVNSMAAAARGDWLLIFNDDAKMATEKWDQNILRTVFIRPWFGCWDICLLWLKTINSDAKQFPMLRRKAFEIMGHFSLSPHNDTWIIQIFLFLRMGWPCETIEVLHPKSSAPGDYSKNSGIKRPGFGSEPTIHSLQAKCFAIEDAEKLVEYLCYLKDAAVWVGKPDRPGWWYWDTNGAEGNLVLVDANGKTYGCLGDGKGVVEKMEDLDLSLGGRFFLVNPL